MKKLIYILLSFFSFCATALASHCAGGQLSYEWQGENIYKLSALFYTDYSGITIPVTVTITMTSLFSNVNSTLTLSFDGSLELPSCNNKNKTATCDSGTFLGLRLYSYSNTINLGSRYCSDWVFSWWFSCRKSVITEVSNSDTDYFRIYSTLNNINGSNSESHDNSLPYLFKCSGNTITIGENFFDATGDSLVYSVIVPIAPQRKYATFEEHFNPFSYGQPTLTNSEINFVNGKLLIERNIQLNVLNNSSAVLPVEWADFTGKVVNNLALLDWQRASERNHHVPVLNLFSFADTKWFFIPGYTNPTTTFAPT